jgi:hypothetical protein
MKDKYMMRHDYDRSDNEHKSIYSFEKKRKTTKKQASTDSILLTTLTQHKCAPNFPALQPHAYA